MKRIILIVIFICLHLNNTQVATAGEGHDAGREWAEQNGIDDPDDCQSQYFGRWADDNINNSPSFTEGCLEYLRDEGITNDDDEIINDDDERVNEDNEIFDDEQSGE